MFFAPPEDYYADDELQNTCEYGRFDAEIHVISEAVSGGSSIEPENRVFRDQAAVRKPQDDVLHVIPRRMRPDHDPQTVEIVDHQRILDAGQHYGHQGKGRYAGVRKVKRREIERVSHDGDRREHIAPSQLLIKEAPAYHLLRSGLHYNGHEQAEKRYHRYGIKGDMDVPVQHSSQSAEKIHPPADQKPQTEHLESVTFEFFAQCLKDRPAFREDQAKQQEDEPVGDKPEIHAEEAPVFSVRPLRKRPEDVGRQKSGRPGSDVYHQHIRQDHRKNENMIPEKRLPMDLQNKIFHCLHFCFPFKLKMSS